MFMRYLKKATRGEFDDEEIEREIEEGKKEELLRIAGELGLDVEKLRDKPVEEIRRAVRERLRK